MQITLHINTNVSQPSQGSVLYVCLNALKAVITRLIGVIMYLRIVFMLFVLKVNLFYFAYTDFKFTFTEF